MTLAEFVESKTYKTVMKYVYGWGASVVLLGALFKIMHFPGAGPMLVAGMGTEVLIFFLSAFEPLHEEPDWTLVYPELAGMTNELDDDLPHGGGYMPQRDSRLFNVSQQPIPEQVAGDSGAEGVPVAAGVAAGMASGGRSTALERFDELLEKAELGPELFVKMGEGIERLANTAQDLNKMQDAVIATENYATNMQTASESAKQLSETYNSSTDVIQSSAGSLSEATLKAAEKIEQGGAEMAQQMTDASQAAAQKLADSGDEIAGIAKKSSEALLDAANNAGQQIVESVKNTGDQLSQSYQEMVTVMNKNIDTLKGGSESYIEQLDIQNKHLTALNSIYELQRDNLTQQNEQSQQLYAKANEAIENMSAAVDDTQKYKEQLNKLNDNLASLNNVYGNMLSSFNLNVNE
jgi:gliding motility-associated protein GldL